MPKPLTLLRKARRLERIQAEIDRRYKMLDELRPDVIRGLLARNGRPLPAGKKSTEGFALQSAFDEKFKAFKSVAYAPYKIVRVKLAANP